MILFSDWARRQRNGAASPGGGAPAAIAAIFADLMDGLEQSLRLNEECRGFEQVAELRSRWKRDFESARAKAVSSKIEEIEARLTSSVEAALTPLLEEAVVEKGLEDFCALLQRHLQTASAQPLVIKSPAALRAMLNAELDSRGIAASIEEHSSGEISASVDGAEIETDIGAWVGRLRKVAA